MSARTSVAFALVLAFPCVVRAANLHPALARAKQATGGARWDAVQTIYTRATLKVGGLEGVVEDWADVRRGRYAHRYTLGPARGGEGYDGARFWTQDDSGQVRVEESTDAREGAADQAYRTALAYWFPQRWPASIEDGGEKREGDRRFTVVRITPRGGRLFELWIDVATGLIDRYAEKDATRVGITFLSDYREVAGVRVPFAMRQTTGDPKYDAVFTVEGVSFDEPLDDARFAPPPPPPPDFAIGGGATSATVPFELLNNHIYVDVRLNGRGPFRLLCDTGGSNIVTPEVARELGVEAQGALEVRGAGGVGGRRAREDRDGAGRGGERADQLFLVLPFDELSAVEGISVQGLIGYEIFKRFVVTLDYPGRTLTVHAPGAFRDDGRGVPCRSASQGTSPRSMAPSTGSRARSGSTRGLAGRSRSRARSRRSTGSRSGMACASRRSRAGASAARPARSLLARSG